MSRGRNGYCNLAIEQMENREVFDGDVTAVLNGNTLTITGDALGNIISVTQISATQVRIDGGQTTGVNGASYQDFDFAGGNLRINLGDGADIVTIGNGTTQVDLNSLAVNLGELYDYMGRRLLKATTENRVEMLDEVVKLLHEIRTAWVAIPNEARGK